MIVTGRGVNGTTPRGVNGVRSTSRSGDLGTGPCVADAVRHVVADTLGFAASKTTRRMVGLGTAADVAGIADVAAGTRAAVRASRIAEHLIPNRRALGSVRAVAAAVTPLGATPLDA